MQTKNSYYITSFFLVFFAGLLWSFGVVTVRYMIDAHQYVFQYLFCRGISIALILICYLFFKEGFDTYKNLSKISVGHVAYRTVVDYCPGLQGLQTNSTNRFRRVAALPVSTGTGTGRRISLEWLLTAAGVAGRGRG